MRMHRLWLASALIGGLVVLAVGGCASAGATPTPAPTATPTPTPTLTPRSTVTPSPTIDVALLAQNYLTIVNKLAREENDLWANYGTQQTWGQFQALGTGYAQIDRDFMTALGTLVFPESMQADLQEVLRTVDADRVIELQLSAVQIEAKASALLKDAAASQAACTRAIDKLCQDLGLSSPPISA